MKLNVNILSPHWIVTSKNFYFGFTVADYHYQNNSLQYFWNRSILLFFSIACTGHDTIIDPSLYVIQNLYIRRVDPQKVKAIIWHPFVKNVHFSCCFRFIPFHFIPFPNRRTIFVANNKSHRLPYFGFSGQRNMHKSLCRAKSPPREEFFGFFFEREGVVLWYSESAPAAN